MIENKLKHLLVFLKVFYNVILRLFGTSYVTSNLLFFEIVDIHTMLKHLKQVIDTTNANDKQSEGIEEIG